MRDGVPSAPCLVVDQHSTRSPTGAMRGAHSALTHASLISEQAAPRVEQVRFGAFVRQLCIALDQGLQNSFVILRRALMKLQLTPVGTLASTANGACDLNQ